jgi:16S rRNA C967 or C1407 C5-methylase (RsmB/RsmF family)
MSAPELEHLRRYGSLVTDVEVFMACARRPLPRVVWANPLKGDVADIDARILARCPEAVPVPWRPHAWRLPVESSPGAWTEYLTGQIHVQEEAALWPVALLGVQPGERVLDMCAAPGGKTAQLALAMHDQGLLVANDRSPGRMAALRRTLDRLGVTCAAVTCEDGKRMSGEALYDRVLADVPCTCEATHRKKGGRTEAIGDKFRDTIVQIQKALLRKALKLVKPGGTVVYATCTYAPEENEAVLHAVDPALAVIEPITPPEGLHVRPGIPSWNGVVFRPDVINAARLWPQDNDTGGFFCARLRRL